VIFPAQRPATAPPAPAPSASTASAPQAAPSAAPAAGPAEAGGAPSVTFGVGGEPIPVAPGQTVCDVAEAHGIALNAECHAGICGSDPIRVLAGAEHLSPLGDAESETLEELCELEPGPCRLACRAKVTGPVVVEVVSKG
jgi:ferredoxin